MTCLIQYLKESVQDSVLVNLLLSGSKYGDIYQYKRVVYKREYLLIIPPVPSSLFLGVFGEPSRYLVELTPTVKVFST